MYVLQFRPPSRQIGPISGSSTARGPKIIPPRSPPSSDRGRRHPQHRHGAAHRMPSDPARPVFAHRYLACECVPAPSNRWAARQCPRRCPVVEPGTGQIVFGEAKWLSGLRVCGQSDPNELQVKLSARHPTGKGFPAPASGGLGINGNATAAGHNLRAQKGFAAVKKLLQSAGAPGLNPLQNLRHGFERVAVGGFELAGVIRVVADRHAAMKSVEVPVIAPCLE